MKQNKNVYVKRRGNAVHLIVKHNTKEGDYITRWMDSKNMLNETARLILAMPEANISSYTIKTIAKKCSVAKTIEKLMKQKIQSALNSMPNKNIIFAPSGAGKSFFTNEIANQNEKLNFKE